jgi:hypothetical protein
MFTIAKQTVGQDPRRFREAQIGVTIQIRCRQVSGEQIAIRSGGGRQRWRRCDPEGGSVGHRVEMNGGGIRLVLSLFNERSRRGRERHPALLPCRKRIARKA